MRYLFLISHPAHYHLFKHFIKMLHSEKQDVKILVRPKDVLVDLMNESGLTYELVSSGNRKSGKLNMLLSLFSRIVVVLFIARKYKPNFLIGSDSTLAFVGAILKIPSFEFSEDDESVIKLYARLSYPFYTNIISPMNCSAGKWEYKKIGYAGYHESAYLTPKHFVPSESIVEKYGLVKPYSIVRFSSLNAHHDGGIKGITTNMSIELIAHIKQQWNLNIYITSEKELDADFEPYRLKINPVDVHHILAYANILVSDSQSMSMEAAVIGTPSLRISSFAGKISVLEELEHTYGLTYGVQPSIQMKDLLSKIDSILEAKKSEYSERRAKMLEDKIDFDFFMHWFFSNYPKSKDILKDNQGYQLRFK